MPIKKVWSNSSIWERLWTALHQINKTPHPYSKVRSALITIQVMNALLILDAKEIVQISPKDKSETLSSNMSAKRL